VDAHTFIEAAAKDTIEMLSLPERRRQHIAGARQTGKSYNAISKEIIAELVRQGLTIETVNGAGVGPDNIRKMLS
jgi:hypothetical protein